MKNIFHICSTSISRISGPRNSVSNLINHSLSTISKTSLITDKSNIEYFSKKLNIRDIYSYSRIFKLIINHSLNPDDHVFVFHSTFILKSLLLSIILRIYGFPYIIFPRGGLTKKALSLNKFKKMFFIKILFGKFFSSARFTIYLTNNEKNDSLKFTNTYYFLPNGVDPQWFSLEKLVKQNNIKSKSISTGLIARLEVYHKGIDIYLGYLDKFLMNNPTYEVSANLFGPTSLQLEKLLSNNSYNFCNLYSPSTLISQKSNFLSSIDLFICLSRFEGQPQALLEAIAYGLPCIVSDGSNMSDVVSDYQLGWVVNSYETFSMALIEFSNLTIFQRNELTTRCRSYALNELKWNNISPLFQKICLKTFN